MEEEEYKKPSKSTFKMKTLEQMAKEAKEEIQREKEPKEARNVYTEKTVKVVEGEELTFLPGDKFTDEDERHIAIIKKIISIMRNHALTCETYGNMMSVTLNSSHWQIFWNYWRDPVIKREIQFNSIAPHKTIEGGWVLVYSNYPNNIISC